MTTVRPYALWQMPTNRLEQVGLARKLMRENRDVLSELAKESDARNGCHTRGTEAAATLHVLKMRYTQPPVEEAHLYERGVMDIDSATARRSTTSRFGLPGPSPMRGWKRDSGRAGTRSAGRRRGKQ